MQIVDGPLGMRGRLEDRALVIGEHLEPGGEIARVVGPGLEFGRDAEIGAEETAAELGDQFLSRALAAVLAVAAEIAVDAMPRRRPVPVMPISA